MPGWQPSGSQPWQQPTVGWQPGGSQPWQQAPGSQPWQGPPVMPPPGFVGVGTPGTTSPKTSGKKIALIIGGVLAGVILLVAAAGLFFILTQPNPSITVTSATSSGSIPTGSPDKVFHIQGQKFSHNEAITLLMDGNAAPGASDVHSDSSGAFTLDLTITDDWLVGKHQITARDTSNYVTKTPAQVQIVAAPIIQVQSQYQSGSTPAGAAGTAFHVTGKRFPTKAPITFLLDGKPVSGVQAAESDDHGKVDTQFSVTGDWALGTHAVTAQDAQGDTTQQPAPVVIVHPGESGTPGPNGAPADDASFSVSVSISGTATDGQTISYTDTLKVEGQPDPAGGIVCGVDDDGQPHDFTGTITGSGESYTETIVFSCSGSYKSGHLTYTETATSDETVLSDGTVCVASGAYVYARLDGTFSDSGTVTGTYSRDYYRANCNSNEYLYRNPATGTFTGGEY
jgi:hypothetical protein